MEAEVEQQDEFGPEYDSAGVDISLVRWMLSLTPAERLEFCNDFVNGILAIRELNARP
jgi:hypothetical protein